MHLCFDDDWCNQKLKKTIVSYDNASFYEQ